MTLPTVYTWTGVATLLIDSVAMEDHVAEATFTFERDETEYETWGGVVKSVGPLKGSGQIRVARDEANGSPYRALMDELFTPTAGGIAVVFRPRGAGSGTLRERTFNVVVLSEEIGGAPADIQEATFNVGITGTITDAVQS